MPGGRHRRPPPLRLTPHPPSDPAPAWAHSLRAQQTARHHRHMAVQTIKDGDRSGGAANPDLSQKE